MIARLGASSLFLGGFGSVAYASTIIDIDIPDSNHNKSSSTEISQKQKDDFSSENEKTMTLEDVELLEEKKNCKFVFSDNFKENKNYTVREWFNKKVKKDPQRKDYWRLEFATAVRYYKSNCKWGQVLVLESPSKDRNLLPKLKY